MKHIEHAAVVVFSLIVAAIPTLLISPVVKNFVTNHPAYAVYFPLASAALLAFYRQYEKKQARE